MRFAKRACLDAVACGLKMKLSVNLRVFIWLNAVWLVGTNKHCDQLVTVAVGAVETNQILFLFVAINSTCIVCRIFIKNK